MSPFVGVTRSASNAPISRLTDCLSPTHCRTHACKAGRLIRLWSTIVSTVSIAGRQAALQSTSTPCRLILHSLFIDTETTSRRMILLRHRWDRAHMARVSPYYNVMPAPSQNDGPLFGAFDRIFNWCGTWDAVNHWNEHETTPPCWSIILCEQKGR